MTVSNTQIRASYTGDGISVSFPIPYPFYLPTDIEVLLGGGQISIGYAISGGAGSSGVSAPGTLVMAVAPASGVNIQVILNVPLTQLVNLVDGTAFPSATLNQVNDRTVQAELRLSDIISRCLRAPDGDVFAWPVMALASQRAGKALMFDAVSGLPTLGVPSIQTITAGLLGALLNVTTEGEESAGVTPTFPQWPVLHPKRYGVLGDGVTDDTAALTTWVRVVNATTRPTSMWPVDGAFTPLCAALPTITANDFTWKANGCKILVKPGSWLTTGDGSTHVLLTGNGTKVYDLTVDGQQSAWSANPTTGRLFQWVGSGCQFAGCSFVNSPGEGMRCGATKASLSRCHFDNNANLGFEGNVVSYLRFEMCTFNANGYGFQGTFVANQFAAFGFVVRYRSHHITMVNCDFNLNGRDGCCVNQGSYAIKKIACLAWMNGDGGFTYTNDAGSPPGSVEPPYDCEEIDCEAYNNYNAGLAAYSPVINLTVVGGRYYNNHRNAGLLPDEPSYDCGIFIGPGSVGVNIDTKCYDDRQSCVVTGSTVSGGSAVVAATNWGVGAAYPSGTFIATIQDYPQVVFHNAAGLFEGYGTATAESSGSVSVASTANNGVTLASIAAGWTISQRVQHTGIYLDNGCQGQVNCDGFGFSTGPGDAGPGTVPQYGIAVYSGCNANGQNVRLPKCRLDPAYELLLNSSFEASGSASLTSWSFTTPSGGSSSSYTGSGGLRRSLASVELVGGTSATSTGSASLDTSAAYAAQNCFVEFSMWVYALGAGDGGISLGWVSGVTELASGAEHPGGGWALLTVSGFMPVSPGIVPTIFSNAGKTCYFDQGSLRPVITPLDNRSTSYPSRNLAV